MEHEIRIVPNPNAPLSVEFDDDRGVLDKFMMAFEEQGGDILEPSLNTDLFRYVRHLESAAKYGLLLHLIRTNADLAVYALPLFLDEGFVLGALRSIFPPRGQAREIILNDDSQHKAAVRLLKNWYMFTDKPWAVEAINMATYYIPSCTIDSPQFSEISENGKEALARLIATWSHDTLQPTDDVLGTA